MCLTQQKESVVCASVLVDAIWRVGGAMETYSLQHVFFYDLILLFSIFDLANQPIQKLREIDAHDNEILCLEYSENYNNGLVSYPCCIFS